MELNFERRSVWGDDHSYAALPPPWNEKVCFICKDVEIALKKMDVNKATGLTEISGRMWMALVKVVGLDEVAKWFN